MTATTTKTVDLEDAIEDTREELDELSREAREAEEGTEEYEDARARFEAAHGRLTAFERAVESWGDGEFVIKQMTFGELMRSKDEVAAQSEISVSKDGDVSGAPKDGFYRVKIMEQAILDRPDQAPEHPADFPYDVGEWLYERINDLNTAGETDLGNLSPEEWGRDSD